MRRAPSVYWQSRPVLAVSWRVAVVELGCCSFELDKQGTRVGRDGVVEMVVDVSS